MEQEMFVHPKKIIRSLIDVNALAEKVGKSRSSVWKDVAAGNLPAPIKIGGSTRWDENEIDAHIDQLLAERAPTGEFDADAAEDEATRKRRSMKAKVTERDGPKAA